MPEQPVTVSTEIVQPKAQVVLPEIPTSWEKFTVLVIFGGLAVYMGYKGNTEAMTGFATALGSYVMSRQGV